MHSSLKRLVLEKGQCLILQPELVKELGKSSALFLQQLHYWLTNDGKMGQRLNGQKWVYNSYKSWADNIGVFSQSTVRRAVSKLEKTGIILSSNMNKKKSDHTKWYTINYSKLYELLPNLLSPKQEQLKPSLESSHSLPKMNSPCVQNEQIINKEAEITSENKTLSSEKIRIKPKKIISQQVDLVKTENEIKIKNNLANELLEIWNQTVVQGGSLAQLTKKRAQFLVAAFKNRFDSSLEQWKKFCEKITTSDFLMGKVKSTFRASLDWVLKFDIMQRILEGDFGIGKASPCEPLAILLDQEIIQQIENSATSPTEQMVKKTLLKTLGLHSFKAWFKDVTIERQRDTLIIRAKSQFQMDYLDTHYRDILRNMFDGVFLHLQFTLQR